MKTNTIFTQSSVRRRVTWQHFVALAGFAAVVACSDAPLESVTPDAVDGSKAGNGNAIVVSDAAALQGALVAD